MIRYLKSRKLKIITAIVLLTVVLFNIVVYQQAYRFTHYVEYSGAIPQLEKISLLEKIKLLFTGVDVARPINHRTPAQIGLSYEVHRIKIAENESLEGWYIATPDPRGLVIMFHGYATSKDTLLELAKAFHEFGYSVFLIDFRGSGGSTGNNTTLGVREGIDVAETVRYAQKHIPAKPLILYGFSLGSAAILRAVATENITPDAIILEHPFDTLLNTTRNRFTALKIPSLVTAEMLIVWGSFQQSFNGFDLNPAQWAKFVKCPTLIFHGEKDVRVSRDQAYAVFENIASVEKQFESFSGAGHDVLVNIMPDT